jgi:two-component system chemotaxis response regulator CheY
MQASGEAAKALVVESSSTMRSVLSRILSTRGFKVAEAEDGRQALDVYRRIGMADLVLINWNARENDNLDFVAQLRHETEHDTVVIMLVASEPGMRDLKRALIAGVDDYLITPFTSEQMDEKLEQAGFNFQEHAYCSNGDMLHG